MKHFVFLMGSIILLALLAGCVAAQPTATLPPPTDLPPTAPPPTLPPPTATNIIPTETQPPTATTAPTNTPLPEGVLFRDDFNGTLQPGWTWEFEDPTKWSFTDDGSLQIIGQSESLLGDERQKNLLWRDLPEGDFTVTVHIITKPFANFQQTAIFLYEDPNNYVTINRGYCDVCPTGGNGFYMDYKTAGAWGDYLFKTEATDVYIRLESKGQIISGYYATQPDDWHRLGRFGNYFAFKKVGLGVSNIHAADAVVGQYDWFEISK